MVSLQLNYDNRNLSATDQFLDAIKSSGMLESYYWESAKEPGMLPVAQSAIRKKCLRLIKNSIKKREYRQDIFPFIDSIDEPSKIDLQVSNAVLGFGSYKNPRKTPSLLLEKTIHK